jgi:hypothetical protein
MTSGTPHDGDAHTGEPVRQVDGGPRLRASDADREATVSDLRDAVARGLLDHDEGGERMAAAFAARFRDELPLLTADLPPSAAAGAAAAPGWRSVGSTAVAQLRSDARATLAAGPRSRRFVLTVLVAVLLMVMLVAVGYLTLHGLLDGGHQLDGPGFEGRGFDGPGFQGP